MRLTKFSEFALRFLLYTANHADRLVTVHEVASALELPGNHLVKVANVLVHAGFLKSVRGRLGGVKLGRRPAAICLGDVVRATEPTFQITSCLSCRGECAKTVCRLRDVLDASVTALFNVLDSHTLHDLMLDAPALALGDCTGDSKQLIP